MEEEKKLNIKKLLHFDRLLINKQIFLFLIQLVSKIFLKDGNTTKNDKLEEQTKKFLKKINDEIIKDKNKSIGFEYTERNLNNIFNFIKMQNSKFASEIFENILIIVFSFGFCAERQKTFGKYLYNSLRNVKTQKNIKIKKTQKDRKYLNGLTKINLNFLIKTF